MPLLAPNAIYRPTIGIYPAIDWNDEAVTSSAYANNVQTAREQIYRSTFWQDKLRFANARQRLENIQSLGPDWDTYGAEPPNAIARTLAGKILDLLETASLPPTCLNPTVEGGIAISFIENVRRAVIEIYNTGEVAAATYSDEGEPIVWEPVPSEVPMRNSIYKIRVHLAA
jgi:hypothetical protein